VRKVPLPLSVVSDSTEHPNTSSAVCACRLAFLKCKVSMGRMQVEG